MEALTSSVVQDAEKFYMQQADDDDADADDNDRVHDHSGVSSAITGAANIPIRKQASVLTVSVWQTVMNKRHGLAIQAS